MENYDLGHTESMVVRLVVAAVLGTVIGFTKQGWLGEAGMRIHILVALGAATFVLALLETIPNADQGAISQVIQGVATGVGFLGAGAILQNRNEERIDGMTAAATIWLAAAVGMAVGLGRLWLPLLGIVVWLAAVGLHWLHETGRFAWLRKLLKRVKFW